MFLPARSTAVLLLALLVLPACSGIRRESDQRRQFRDRALLTHDQLNEVAFNNAYQAVETLRSHWLRTRGPSSPHSTGTVMVYLNNTRLGGVDSLRGLTTREIVYIRFYDAVSAAGRWGRDVVHGVIYVSTERP